MVYAQMSTTYHPEQPALTRREFLAYLGAASLSLTAAASCGAVAWYATPHIQYGESSGVFQLALDELPQTPMSPLLWKDFSPNAYLMMFEDGLVAFDRHCVFLDYLQIKWQAQTFRYACPGCGSQYRLDGSWIAGPARRGLDRFAIEVKYPTHFFPTRSNGEPISIEGAESIVLDTRTVIRGAAHT
jgi:cytochrome b6-f complex iron-sulfur subunit